MNRTWYERMMKGKPSPEWTGFPLPEQQPKNFRDVEALVPDVLPPASKIAQREAWHVMRYGSLNDMNIHPTLTAKLAVVAAVLVTCYRSDLPGFVRLPVLAFLLDQWCVESNHG